MDQTLDSDGLQTLLENLLWSFEETQLLQSFLILMRTL